MKILVAGYYGFGNVGDELILSVLLQQIHRHYPSAQVTVLSANPLGTQQVHGVRAVGRWNMGSLMRTFWETDLFLLGGGGLLQDLTSNRSLYYYLSLVGWALFFRCRVALYAIGVETVKNPFNRRLIRWILNRSTVTITVRDLESKALLLEMGCDASRIHVTGDPVFLSTGIVRNAQRFSPQSNRVLFIPRFPCPPAGENLYCELLNELKQMRKMEVEGALFCPSREEPLLLKSEIMRELTADYFLMSEIPVAILNEIVKADYIVSSRLHGLILAVLIGRPFLGVGDEEKIGRFCRSWGRPFLPWDSDRRTIQLKLAELMEEATDIPIEQVDEWKHRARTTLDTILTSTGLDS